MFINKDSTINYLKVIFIPVLILIFNSCRIALIPNYDENISKQIDNIARHVDKFYLEMLETTNKKNDGRAYDKFTESYINIEVELNSLLVQNKIRPLNENSIRICEITLQLWIKYKNEHKTDNTLSDGLIILNRKTFDDLFYAMQVAEAAKNIINNPPE